MVADGWMSEKLESLIRSKQARFYDVKFLPFLIGTVRHRRYHRLQKRQMYGAAGRTASCRTPVASAHPTNVFKGVYSGFRHFRGRGNVFKWV